MKYLFPIHTWGYPYRANAEDRTSVFSPHIRWLSLDLKCSSPYQELFHTYMWVIQDHGIGDAKRRNFPNHTGVIIITIWLQM